MKVTHFFDEVNKVLYSKSSVHHHPGVCDRPTCAVHSLTFLKAFEAPNTVHSVLASLVLRRFISIQSHLEGRSAVGFKVSLLLPKVAVDRAECYVHRGESGYYDVINSSEGSLSHPATEILSSVVQGASVGFSAGLILTFCLPLTVRLVFQACQLDPMLDDSVMFARPLRDVGAPVTLDVLPDLPHGFLNFTLVSVDAKQGSDTCIMRLRQMLREPEDELCDVLDSDGGDGEEGST